MERIQKSGILGDQLLTTSRKYISGDYPPHFHDFYEIEYVIAGQCHATVNGREKAYLPGMLCFLTPVDWHSVYSSGAEVYNIMFSEQLVDFWLLEPFLRFGAPKAVRILPEMRPFVQQLFQEIVEHHTDAQYCALLMSCLLRKLAQVFLLPERVSSSDTLLKVLSYVIGNYRTPITLGSAAAHIGLTPSYLSALFKKEMHVGFKAYLNSLRLEYAKKLLVSTELSIRQICEDSGFEDVPNFIKRFKSVYGSTPTEMRKRHTSLQTQPVIETCV